MHIDSKSGWRVVRQIGPLPTWPKCSQHPRRARSHIQLRWEWVRARRKSEKEDHGRSRQQSGSWVQKLFERSGHCSCHCICQRMVSPTLCTPPRHESKERRQSTQRTATWKHCPPHEEGLDRLEVVSPLPRGDLHQELERCKDSSPSHPVRGRSPITWHTRSLRPGAEEWGHLV